MKHCLSDANKGFCVIIALAHNSGVCLQDTTINLVFSRPLYVVLRYEMKPVAWAHMNGMVIPAVTTADDDILTDPTTWLSNSHFRISSRSVATSL